MLTYYHVDVFSPRPYSGNSLAVFPEAYGLSTGQMQIITQELRHFESIFLEGLEQPGGFRARVFDSTGELDFAGYPVLGAAGALHSSAAAEDTANWSFHLNDRTVTVTTHRTATGYSGLQDQGEPIFLGELPRNRWVEFAEALNLDANAFSEQFRPEVVSTGLRYLVVPVERGLCRARIVHREFDRMLASINAQFVYVVDVNLLDGRTWTNDGVLEDVATGSAAGTVAAYMTRFGRMEPNREWLLKQGRFTGRPCEMRVWVNGTASDIRSVLVGGDVTVMGQGTLNSLPMEAV